ncbi:MAG: O-antigen ligase family protein [Elusimicrobiaceae bacterium]|nr:O-antigen ligase family protein [Elusimicrobiaceae bacterium]
MDLFLRILLIILSFFVPFCFAGTVPWAFSILQMGVWILLAGIFFSGRQLVITPLLKPVLYTLGVLVAYSLLQCVATQNLLMTTAFYPATLMRLYTLEHASCFITYLGWAFAVGQLVDSSERAGRMVRWLGACAVAIAISALCLSKGEYIYKLTGIWGGYGPFLNRNHGGIFLAACTVLFLGWTCASFAKIPRDLGSARQTFWARQSWGVLVALGVGVAAVFSRSRGGLLSLSVGLCCLAVLCALIVPAVWGKRARWLVLILLVFGSGTYWACTHLETINRFAQRRHVHDVSIETRQMLYRAGWGILQDYPVWGIGVGALPVVVTSYLEKPISSYVERLHSDWLEMGVGLGGVGSLLVLGGLIWFIWVIGGRFKHLEMVKKIKLAATLSALVTICTGALADFPFFIPATALLFFGVLGLACAPSFWKGRIHTYQPAAWLRVLILLVMAAACIVPLQKTLAWRMFTFGRGLKPEARFQYYRKGLSYYPGPRFALRLGNDYYRTSLHATDPARKEDFRKQAHQLAAEYLRKYPREKSLSRLYTYTRDDDELSR